jgi:uncharacterized repeat protein (TIGR01451 family)
VTFVNFRALRPTVTALAAVLATGGLTLLHAAPAAEAVPSTAMQWPTAVSLPAPDTFSASYGGVPGLTGTYTVGTTQGGSVTTVAYSALQTKPNVPAYQEPEAPDATPYFAQTLDASSTADTITGTYAFSKPVASPVFNALNMDSSRMVITGANIAPGTPIVTNAALEVSGTTLNNSTNVPDTNGCTLDSAPAVQPVDEGCASIPLTTGSGTVLTMNLANTIPTPFANRADGWFWAISVPTVPLTATFADPGIPVGGVTQLTFTLDNTANPLAVGPLDFTIPLPAGLTIADANTSSNGCGDPTLTDLAAAALPGAGTGLTATAITAAAGQACRITVHVIAAARGTYTVTPSANPTLATSIVANVIPGAGDTLLVPLEADLSLTKSSDPDHAAPGSSVTWTLTVRNLGPGPSSGYTVSDAVPNSVTNLATATAGCAIAGQNVTCVEGPLPVGELFTITFTGTAPQSGRIDNTAVVVGDDPDPHQRDNTATFRTHVEEPAPPAETRGEGGASPPANCDRRGVAALGGLLPADRSDRCGRRHRPLRAG